MEHGVVRYSYKFAIAVQLHACESITWFILELQGCNLYVLELCIVINDGRQLQYTESIVKMAFLSLFGTVPILLESS